jgi:hypothetical protein
MVLGTPSSPSRPQRDPPAMTVLQVAAAIEDYRSHAAQRDADSRGGGAAVRHGPWAHTSCTVVELRGFRLDWKKK